MKPSDPRALAQGSFGKLSRPRKGNKQAWRRVLEEGDFLWDKRLMARKAERRRRRRAEDYEQRLPAACLRGRRLELMQELLPRWRFGLLEPKSYLWLIPPTPLQESDLQDLLFACLLLEPPARYTLQVELPQVTVERLREELGPHCCVSVIDRSSQDREGQRVKLL